MLRDRILEDVFTALDRWAGKRARQARRLIMPLAWPSAHQFAKLFAGLDSEIAQRGIAQAMQGLLPRFARSVEVRGAEQVPAEGPLLVLANHPGTFDSVVVAASLGRDDLQIVALGWPVFRHLPSLSNHLIFTSMNPGQQISAVRDVIRRLQAGAALLVFPTADLDPDPDVQPGAEEALSAWSRSFELFLRKVPETQVLVAVVSGVVSPKILRHPLARLPRTQKGQRTVAELLQMGRHVLLPWDLGLAPRISFGQALNLHQLGSGDDASDSLRGNVIEQARALLAAHMNLPRTGAGARPG